MLFSVVIPVYNVEPYLRQCVESVLGQTVSRLELILVDDGSTDGSGAMCDEFAAADPRVRVIHQENAGLVGARQAGISQATGEYVLYVDADDWILPGLLEDASGQISQHGADVVTYPFVSVRDGRESEAFMEPVPAGAYDKEAMRRVIYPYLLQGKNMRNILSYITGKVVRRDLLNEAQMRIPGNLELGEDAACTIELYLGSRVVCIREAPMYCYRVRADSSCHRFRMHQFDQVVSLVQYFETNAPPEIEDFDRQLDRYVMMGMLCLLLSAIGAGARKELPAIRSAMKRPLFMKHMARAEFEGLSPKARLTFLLLRRGMIGTAWALLAVCERLKKGWKQWGKG